jgi:hypothetical protein
LRTGVTRAAAWFCSALVLATVSAQTTVAPQAAPAQALPLLRATTRLVQVSVVVHDKKGEPVLGLTKDDFDITDAGVPPAGRHAGR